MNGEEMKEMDIFVAPASTAELDHIIASVDSDRQFVFNTFAVRNTAYQDNSNVIQANIPHTRMYQRAIDAFMQEMAGRTPIFIQRIGGTADKEEFTSMLKSQLADKGIEYKEITYENTLKDGDFAGFDTSGSYVIVPLSRLSYRVQQNRSGYQAFQRHPHISLRPCHVRISGMAHFPRRAKREPRHT